VPCVSFLGKHPEEDVAKLQEESSTPSASETTLVDPESVEASADDNPASISSN
jgi:hypothetical protein